MNQLGVEWYYYGWDEPHATNFYFYALQQYKYWHEGGAPTYVTGGVRWDFLDVPCMVLGAVRTEAMVKYHQQICKHNDAQFWWYGTGSYIGCETRLVPNRYRSGYYFWKTGARAQVSWTFMRVQEDPYNDFDGVKVNPQEPKEQCTAYPRPMKPGDWSTYQGAIPTLQWEGLREGVNDYLYAWTLKSLAQEAMQSPQPAVRMAGRRALQQLRRLMEAVPWPKDDGPQVIKLHEGPGHYGNEQCEAVRWAICEKLLKLQSVIARHSNN